MSLFLFNNNVRVTFASAVSAGDNTLTITNPSAPFNLPATPAGGVNGVLTLVDSVVAPTKVEVVTYTGITDNGNGTHTLTGVTRAREGTTAQSFLVGEFGYQALTGALLNALKGMALQAPNAVAITGGTINGTAIGATTQSTVAATTYSATSSAAFAGNLALGSSNPSVSSLSSGQYRVVRNVGSPVSVRTEFGGDGSGWQYRIALNNSGAITDLLTIQDNGNVAIGTTTASYRFNVAGDGNVGNCAIALVDTSASNKEWRIDQSGGDLRFIESGVGQHFTILDGGNVGIGTTSPGEKLSVAGNILATGTIKSTLGGSGGSDSAFVAEHSTGPKYGWNVTGQSANGRLWDAVAIGNQWSLRAVNDALSAAGVAIRVTRTAAAIDSVEHLVAGTVRQLINSSGQSITGSSRSTIGFEYDAEVDDGTSGTSKTINWTTGHRRRLLMSGNCTITFTAPAKPCSLILKLTTSAGSGTTQTITWPASIKWAGGIVPDHRTGNSKTHIFSFYFDGTNYYGSAMLDCA